MEGGNRKKAVDVAGSSSGLSSASGNSENGQETSQKSNVVFDAMEEEVEPEAGEDSDDEKDGRRVTGFTPGPPVSLKEQIEKDKVFLLSPSFSFCITFMTNCILGFKKNLFFLSPIEAFGLMDC